MGGVLKNEKCDGQPYELVVTGMTYVKKTYHSDKAEIMVVATVMPLTTSTNQCSFCFRAALADVAAAFFGMAAAGIVAVFSIVFLCYFFIRSPERARMRCSGLVSFVGRGLNSRRL